MNVQVVLATHSRFSKVGVVYWTDVCVDLTVHSHVSSALSLLGNLNGNGGSGYCVPSALGNCTHWKERDK